MKFTKHTIPFLAKAGRQKHPEWLDKNRADYLTHVLEPYQHLARTLKQELQALAPAVHFPQKGIGRLRRPSNRVGQGGGLYRNWLGYSASRPSGSRFEHHPSLFFMINSQDADDPVLLAGGLYMPSSKQVRAIREAIAHDSTPFEKLFKDRAFQAVFPDGFATDRKAARFPRGFDPAHSHASWLQLNGFYVWKPYKLRDFYAATFAQQVAHDGRQVLRLNALLEQACGTRPAASLPKTKLKEVDSLASRLEKIAGHSPRVMDF